MRIPNGYVNKDGVCVVLSQAIPMGDEKNPMTSSFIGRIIKGDGNVVEMQIANGTVVFDEKLVIACFLPTRNAGPPEVMQVEAVERERIPEVLGTVPR